MPNIQLKNSHCFQVGTKLDLRDDADTCKRLAETFNEKSITQEEGTNLAKEHKAVKYVECSALTQKGMSSKLVLLYLV